jgi:hypothetical protein
VRFLKSAWKFYQTSFKGAVGNLIFLAFVVAPFWFAHSPAACERYLKLWGSVGIGMFAGFQFGLRLSKKDREELLMTKEDSK